MPAPLIAPRWRAGALTAIVLAVLVVGWLGVVGYHAGTTDFDSWVLRTAYRHLDLGTAHALRAPSEPALTIGLMAAVTLTAALRRRWDLAVLAAAGPLLAQLVTELVLKPVVGRLIGPYAYQDGSLLGAVSGSFPSGHETGVASAAVVLLIVAAQLPVGRAGRLAVFVVLALWTLLAAVGVVRNFYHYATDTLGAIGVSIAVVLGVALAVDRWFAPVLERADIRRRQLT